MSNYKLKYIKYKLKYLNQKNKHKSFKLKGGDDQPKQLLSKLKEHYTELPKSIASRATRLKSKNIANLKYLYNTYMGKTYKGKGLEEYFGLYLLFVEDSENTSSIDGGGVEDMSEETEMEVGNILQKFFSNGEKIPELYTQFQRDSKKISLQIELKKISEEDLERIINIIDNIDNCTVYLALLQMKKY